MNYLIHAFISKDVTFLTIGNIITDLLKPRDIRGLDERLKAGVRLHRFIDEFSDGHRCVRKSTGRLRSSHHKYAPVAVDLLYDFMLGQYWEEYSQRSFYTFVHTIYKTLNDHNELIPSRIQHTVNKMVEGEWLHDYRTEDGFNRVLQRMDLRASFPSRFGNLLEDWRALQSGLEEDFHCFMPEIIERMDEEINRI